MSNNNSNSEDDSEAHGLRRLSTGIEGLDHILCGGIFAERTLLIAGTSGSAKTLLSLQILKEQIVTFGRRGLFVTFEEQESEIISNVSSFGWNLEQHVESGMLNFIDASPGLDQVAEGGNFDLSGLLSQIIHFIERESVQIVVLDSVTALFQHYDNVRMLRSELLRIVRELREKGVVSILTAERLEEYGLVSKYNIEEFVADGVIILRHVLREEKLRRTLQVYKLRGGEHLKGEFPFTIDDSGLDFMPLSALELTQSSSNERVNFGDNDFDAMTGGGLFQDSVVLIGGPTGAGKTLLCTTFAANGCQDNERTLYLGFEESRPQLIRNANSWGYDFEKWEADGILKISCMYPEFQSLEDHLRRIRVLIEEFKPRRLVVDSVSALERIGDVRVFREFIIGLTSLVKGQNICSVFTSTSPNLSGGDSITDTHISTITDTIVLLRYIERKGELGRGLLIIKMRGSLHDKRFREFTISEKGLSIGESLGGVKEVITGGHDRVGRGTADSDEA